MSINVQDQPGRIKSDIKGENMPYPVLIGRRTGITRDYKIGRLPYLYIIDKTGKIHISKVFMKQDEIEKIINSLINNLGKDK